MKVIKKNYCISRETISTASRTTNPNLQPSTIFLDTLTISETKNSSYTITVHFTEQSQQTHTNQCHSLSLQPPYHSPNLHSHSQNQRINAQISTQSRYLLISIFSFLFSNMNQNLKFLLLIITVCIKQFSFSNKRWRFYFLQKIPWFQTLDTWYTQFSTVEAT